MQAPTPQLVGSPTNANFLGRAFLAVAILGDYLYITGGEVSQLINGKPIPGHRGSDPVNSTLIISLAQSWTPSTVEIIEIDSRLPSVNFGTLWAHEASMSLYAWGGEGAWFAKAKPKALWRFRAQGPQGRGIWTQLDPVALPNESTFNSLQRAGAAAAAQSSGKGYMNGGFANQYTETGFEADVNVAPPGMLTLDFDSVGWTNSSGGDTWTFDPHEIPNAAQAVWLPYGSQGILVIFGGGSGIDNSFAHFWPQKWSTFDHVIVYDIAARTYHLQSTSGSRPSPRGYFCTVVSPPSTSGTNSTYEIFIYGGSNGTQQRFADMFVLSIPGFVFFKAPGPDPLSSTREVHSCVVAGGGGSQMISIGGGQFANDISNTFDGITPDPWPRGIGILDMTQVRWKESYDPAAPAYRSPAFVSSWYSSGGMADVAWANNQVERLFMAQNTTISIPGKPLGVIVGSSVGGGILMIIILGCILWFFRSRRKQIPAEELPLETPGQKTLSPPPRYEKSELSCQGERFEAPSPAPGVELQGASLPPSELPGDFGAELPPPEARVSPLGWVGAKGMQYREHST